MIENHKAWEYAMRIPWWVYLILAFAIALCTQFYTPWRGLVVLSLWQGIALSILLTHLSIIGVTLYLHREQTHRAIELHWVVSHPLRFYLWLGTGMVRREWVANHRKHHAKVETVDDPHSPKIHGISSVLVAGVLLYVEATKDRAMVKRYSEDMSDDWIERHLYTPHQKFGVVFLLLIHFVVFGPIIGVFVLWLTQMAWIPFLAAGVINGAGHYFGYRNFPSRNNKTGFEDWSTNIVPWGVLIGGEELHNNHHWYPQSAKFSAKWYEFDVGWLYIRILEMLGLAKVKYAYVDGKKHNEH